MTFSVGMPNGPGGWGNSHLSRRDNSCKGDEAGRASQLKCGFELRRKVAGSESGTDELSVFLCAPDRPSLHGEARLWKPRVGFAERARGAEVGASLRTDPEAWNVERVGSLTLGTSGRVARHCADPRQGYVAASCRGCFTRWPNPVVVVHMLGLIRRGWGVLEGSAPVTSESVGSSRWVAGRLAAASRGFVVLVGSVDARLRLVQTAETQRLPLAALGWPREIEGFGREGALYLA